MTNIHIYTLDEYPNPEQIKRYCLKMIKHYYNLNYCLDWHFNLDQLPYSTGLYRSPDSEFLIATYNLQIIATIGFCDLNLKPIIYQKMTKYINTHEKIGSIWRLYIHPDYVKKGLGTKLVKLIENHSQQRQIKSIYLHCTGLKNSPKDFWVKMGYQPFFREIDTPDQTIHLIKKLDF